MSKKQTTIDGSISIHTKNIFPIIKKWLYSDHDIFLRELLSNAYDAIKKRDKISLSGSAKKDDVTHEISIAIDKEAKTLSISDTGLGMDTDEIQKYINQIAFSGAEDFLQKFGSDKDNPDIIGHFGLGFYSSFMVASTVEIDTLSYKEGAEPIIWRCEGDTEFTIKPSNRDQVGTTIILHLSDDSKEFLEPSRIETLIKKYANFLPINITLDGKSVNHQNPLWVKQPQDLKKEDYTTFYNELFQFQPEPLFWIHLNVDYPFRVQGILYFPKLTHELDSKKGRVQLYCQNVFVTDTGSEIIPDFLTLLQGAIDCPDFPLNVSRSMLQQDAYVQKLSKYIVKKVADKLVALHKKDLESFKTYWTDIHPFVKYGMMTNTDFYDKVKDIVLFKTNSGDFLSVSDYLKKHDKKLDKTVIYTTDSAAHGTYIDLFKQQDIDVIVLDAVIDSHFIQQLEMKSSDVKFVAVDSAVHDHLVDTDDKSDSSKDEGTADQELITTIFKDHLKKEELTISPKSLKSSTIPAMFTQDEQAKRLKDMSRMMEGSQGLSHMFDKKELIVNTSHPIIMKILSLYKVSKDSPQLDKFCAHVYDIACLSQESLKGSDMTRFIERSTELIVNSND